MPVSLAEVGTCDALVLCVPSLERENHFEHTIGAFIVWGWWESERAIELLRWIRSHSFNTESSLVKFVAAPGWRLEHLIKC